MSNTNAVLGERIHCFFNQLTVGCGNNSCSNSNCASSANFKHSGITNNQAAVIAINLIKNGDSLCSSTDSDSAEQTINKPLQFSTNQLRNSTTSTQSVASSVPQSNRQETEPPILDSNRVRISETALDPFRLTNIVENLQPSSSQNEITRTQEDSISTAAPLSFSPGLSRFLLDMSNRAQTSDDDLNLLHDFADLPLFVPRSDNSRTSTNETTLNSEFRKRLQDRETFAKNESSYSDKIIHSGRMHGLTLKELTACIKKCKKKENWLALRVLLDDVFGSFDALSLSFPIKTVCVGANISINDHESCMDISDSEVPAASFPGNISQSNDILKVDADVDMKTNCAQASTRTDQSNATAVPINILDVQKAYETLLTLPQEADVLSTLIRIISRFTVSKLKQSFLSNPTASMTSSERIESACQDLHIQQKTVNVFVLLYACPLVTDPLYFENFLPRLCRATNWLPMTIQAKLCTTWAEHATRQTEASVSSSTKTLDENCETCLLTLQKILMQHITLRCLTLDSDSSPNDDGHIREASKVLRIVFYASLLAGNIDPEEQRLKERTADEEFAIRPTNNERGQFLKSSRNIAQDPLGTMLKISPNDCRFPLISASEFINETLNDSIEAEKDFLYFRSRGTSEKLSFMELPFLLQTVTKSVQLYYDNRLRMLEERRDALYQSMYAHDPQMPFFKLRVGRESVVEDALIALEIAWQEDSGDLKKQLYVEFDGEQGIDEGGLSKEFFQLIIQRIFNPDYGMFTFDDETQLFWFNPSPMEDLDREYSLIGTILGLAIYNNIILDVHFPSVLYRKLVGKMGNFFDLKEGWPALGHGLQEMLDYTDDDFDDVFCSSFVISYKDMFGTLVTQDLIPGGRDKPVTRENKKEFVDLIADYLLNTAVTRQFNAFRKGFNMVVGDSPLFFLFSPSEIELLVRGSQTYNFSELERVTEYEGNYTIDSEVIKNFWSIVHSLPEPQQRQLLQFATGSDRIPLGGMSKLKFVIARQGPDCDRLPTAHTCFNILLLPEYSTKEKLNRCLLTAIANSKGFGMF